MWRRSQRQELLFPINNSGMTRYILDSSVQVLVASYGGVGTTFLSEEIGRYCRVNDPRDMDGYKHCPVPPLRGSKNLKVIYVVGDPILAAASLFRRGFHADQAGKLQYSKLRRRFPNRNLALEDYAKAGLDLFLFDEHFEAWTKDYVFYPTLVLKYESIYESLAQIGEFLSLPPEFVSDFPPPKERGSSLDKIAQENLENLQKMYGSLQDKINSLPNVFDLPASVNQLAALWDARYWIGGVRDVFWRACHRILAAVSEGRNQLNERQS
jgi:hypothetical protein